MPDPPRTPGVYVREVPGGPPPIAAVDTSVAAFVGAFARGPVDHPVLATGIHGFERVFGAPGPDHPAPWEVHQFFHNGGTRAWIVRVTRGAVAATAELACRGGPVLRVRAATRAGRRSVEDPGRWGNRLRLDVEHGADSSFDLVVRDVGPDGRTRRSETFQGLVLDPGDPAFAPTVVNAVSTLVRLEVDGIPLAGSRGQRPDEGRRQLTGGADGDRPTAASLLGTRGSATGLAALGNGWNLLCLPDAAWMPPADARSAYVEAAGRCAARRAFLLVDPPIGMAAAGELLAWVEGGAGLRSPDASLHVPGLVVPAAALDGGRRTVGTSGTMAGLFARTDRTRGVWKAPAGPEADLRHVLEPAVELGRADLELLNPGGINAIRRFPGRGIVSWGARTLAGHQRGPTEWRYVPVRRLALFIEASLAEGLEWTALEPNGPPLWARVRSAADAFLLSLFRAGALQGTKAEEAWFARCGPETTTESERRQGILWLETGCAPLMPGEFTLILRTRLRTGVPIEGAG